MPSICEVLAEQCRCGMGPFSRRVISNSERCLSCRIRNHPLEALPVPVAGGACPLASQLFVRAAQKLQPILLRFGDVRLS